MNKSGDALFWRVGNPDSGRRLDVWLSERKSPPLSRSAWQRLIRARHVRINGKPVAPNAKLGVGDEVSAVLPPPEKSTMSPEDIPLDVLFEDADLLVINKPAGMVVHPGAGNREHTLVNALLHHCAGKLSGIGGVERPGLVHRLDAETSGCLVIAKNDPTHQALAAQFKTRTVEKIYLAWVRGEIRRPSGRIEAAIGRHPVHRKKMAIVESGRPAVTEWKLREKTATASLLECRILTGRTHQIRVHCLHLGHPIVGDRVYGRAPAEGSPSRHLLHAWKLSFDHPRTAKRLSITAPVPDDFKDFRVGRLPPAN
jgi:23S rRNA pseudouridine1911/1915/1917 synthase